MSQSDAEHAAVIQLYEDGRPVDKTTLRVALRRAIELLQRDCDCHPTELAGR